MGKIPHIHHYHHHHHYFYYYYYYYYYYHHEVHGGSWWFQAVGESVAQPLRYNGNNLVGTLNFLNAMEKYGCNTIGEMGQDRHPFALV